jgi:hypothetical protein
MVISGLESNPLGHARLLRACWRAAKSIRAAHTSTHPRRKFLNAFFVCQSASANTSMLVGALVSL